MAQNFSNCHRTGPAPTEKKKNDSYGDGDIPKEDMNSYYQNVEPLPESSRPRRDGPGGD